MLKATRIINPRNLKRGNIILSKCNDAGYEWYTFRVFDTPTNSYIEIYPDNICSNEIYHFLTDETLFWRLDRRIGWFWGVNFNRIREAVSRPLNLGINQ